MERVSAFVQAVKRRVPGTALLLSFLFLGASQFVEKGKLAFFCLVASCFAGLVGFRTRTWWTGDTDAELAALRQELEDLRLGAALDSAASSALPPLAPPDSNPLQWSPPPSGTTTGLLGALHGAVSDPAPAAAPASAWAPQNLPQQNPQQPAFATTAPQAVPQDLAMVRSINQQLAAFAGTAVSDIHWAQRFWEWIESQAKQGLISQTVMNVLVSHGYIGGATRTAPNITTLGQALELAVTNAANSGVAWTSANSWGADSINNYHTALPGDMRRAATEIYRTLRSDGTASTRAWLKDNFTGYKGASGPWEELWSMATQVDYALSQCTTDAQMLHVLGTDDRVEIALRHLGAYFYEARTRDRAGAAHMRAFGAPGASRDIVPSWMVSEATTFSKCEHQRSERVESEIRRRNQNDKAKGDNPKGGKGENKGKKK